MRATPAEKIAFLDMVRRKEQAKRSAAKDSICVYRTFKSVVDSFKADDTVIAVRLTAFRAQDARQAFYQRSNKSNRSTVASGTIGRSPTIREDSSID